MGDGITVSSGRAIAIDTEQVRAAAGRIDEVTETIRLAARRFEAALEQQQTSQHSDAVSTGWALIPATHALAGDADALAGSLRAAANLYEAIELTLQGKYANTCDPARDARLDELFASDPTLRFRVDQAILMWGAGAGTEASRRIFLSPASWLAGPLVWGSAMIGFARLRWTVGRLNRGAVAPGTRLTGPMPPVTVAPVGAPRAAAAPTDFADTIERIPTTGDTRVAIEKFTGADGEPVAIVYVSGTRPDGGADEAWSWGANVPPYLLHQQSTATAAVAASLTAAGVAPGSRIAVVGYSQGAMVTEYLASSGQYDVAYAQSVGSPVEAEVGPDTVHVQMINEDDPLAAVVGGGLGMSTGAPESIVIERESDAGIAWKLEDLADPHQLDEYHRTAELADQSDDPRVVEILRALRGLTNGEPGVRYEYGARAGG